MAARLRRLFVLCAAALPAAAGAADSAPRDVAQAEYRWSQSPYGMMLARILPPALEPKDLPEPRSAGARLTAQYCIQCHYLPSPAMHNAERWPAAVNRMAWRMQGHGNMGALMKEMMAEVRAPSPDEQAVLTRYLQRHAMPALDPARYPSLKTPPGRAFEIACAQCHEPPDPQRHTAREWPRVVERMQRHMQWANTVNGAPELRTTPELKIDDIVRFLQRNARKE